MKKNKVKIITILLTVFSILSIFTNAYAHSGRTDASGGHKDNKNKSGLGSYHYHCGGHPAHLHPNGVCPYSSSSSNKKSTSSSSSSSKSSSSSNKTFTSSSSSSNESSTSSNKTTVTEPANIEVNSIQINENINSIEVGESKKITATITPSDATNKNITWKSSDENIATISSDGQVIAKNPGTVQITATSSNGKTNTIKIEIKEEPTVETSTEINTPIPSKNDANKNNVTNNITAQNSEDENAVAGAIALGLIGGGTYLGYKKYKNRK